jgi:hypothetical protein
MFFTQFTFVLAIKTFVSTDTLRADEAFKEREHGDELSTNKTDNFPDLILSRTAQTLIADVEPRTEVSGHHDVGTSTSRKNISSVFLRDAFIHHAMICSYDLFEVSIPTSLSKVFLNRGREIHSVSNVHPRQLIIPLTLLAVACQTMPHQLMGQHTRHAVDGEGDGDMFERGQMPLVHTGLDELVDVFDMLTVIHQVVSSIFRIALTVCRVDDTSEFFLFTEGSRIERDDGYLIHRKVPSINGYRPS